MKEKLKALVAKIPEPARDIIVAVLLLGGISVILLFVVRCAEANEFGFYEGPTVFLGAQYNPRATVCFQDEQWAGDVGIYQPFWRTDFRGGEGRAVLTWTHHSCAFDADRRSYDGIGARMEWRLW